MALNNSLDLTPILEAITTLSKQKERVLVAIDGPCASGKSTLAAELSAHYSAPLFHMDDFFLPPEKRTKERLQQVGGNVDSERFFAEVLSPLSQGQPICYRPWRCKLGLLDNAIHVPSAPLAFVEGAYALRPDLRDYYDLRIFLTAPLPLREERLLARNGAEGLIQFQQKWIPLENRYFEGCGVEACCDIILSF